MSVTSAPWALSAHAVAQPITPAPMIEICAIAVCLADVVPERADCGVRELDLVAGPNRTLAAANGPSDHVAGEEARVQLRVVEKRRPVVLAARELVDGDDDGPERAPEVPRL